MMGNELDINEVMASGDPDLMDQYLKQVSEQDEAKGAEVSEETDANEASATSGAEVEEDAEPVIKSKSGREEIPFSVLQSERERNRALQEQIDALTQQHGSAQQQLNNVKAQLEAKGLDVDTMFRDPDEITPEQWTEVEEDYGNVGKLLRRLFDQVNQSQQAPAATDGGSNEVIQLLETSFKELNSWRTGNPDKWAEAVKLDSELQNNPAWANKSMADRFREVERQVTARSAEQAKQRAGKKIDDSASDQFPDSLSDMGQPPAIGKTRIEQFSSMSPDQLQDAMSRMNPAEIDQLLNSL
jgi:hypothetical protein